MARRLEILADTSGIIALLDRDDRHHKAAVKAIEAQTILIPATIDVYRFQGRKRIN